MRSVASTTVTSRAELAERRAEFQPDIARPDHHQALGDLVQHSASVEEITGPPKGRNGSSTGSEPLARITCSAVMVTAPSRGFDNAGLAVLERRPAVDDPHLGALEQGCHAAVELVDDAVLPAHGLGEVDAGDSPAMIPMPRRVLRRAQRREGAAAWMSALEGMQPRIRQVPPQPVGFDQHGVEAQLAGADRGHVAARAAADDQDLGYERRSLMPAP